MCSDRCLSAVRARDVSVGGAAIRACLQIGDALELVQEGRAQGNLFKAR